MIMGRLKWGKGERGRGGGCKDLMGKFFKEVVFKVDLESDFVILETKVTETVPFSWVGEEGNVI